MVAWRRQSANENVVYGWIDRAQTQSTIAANCNSVQLRLQLCRDDDDDDDDASS